jgi:uncharacterized protein DUF1236
MPEVLMKARLAIAATAMLLLSALGVGAQAPIVPTQPKVNLTLEQRHVIKEIVKDMKVEQAPDNTDVEVGAVLPESVKTQAMPAEITAKVPQIRSHQFLVKDSKVVLVDPKDHRVVEVIE